MTPEQDFEIHCLIGMVDPGKDHAIKLILHKYKVSSLEELNDEQANEVIQRLNKIIDIKLGVQQ